MIRLNLFIKSHSIRLFPRCPKHTHPHEEENVVTVSLNHHFVASQNFETKSQFIKKKARRINPEMWRANIWGKVLCGNEKQERKSNEFAVLDFQHFLMRPFM